MTVTNLKLLNGLQLGDGHYLVDFIDYTTHYVSKGAW